MNIPANPDAITPKWLTGVLHEAGALDHAHVASVETGHVGRLGFTGQLLRLRISYDKAELAAPRSLVAKFSAPKRRTGGQPSGRR